MKIKAAQWQQLSELLDTALELAADERLQWVDALSEELAELKPTLRELLLQTTGVETKDFLDRPPDFAAALMADSTHTDWAEEFQVDKVMGAYRLIRELGRGGMGTVWLAERIDGKLKRQVALKFPYAGPNQRQLAERLAREREILASLEHPNIARLYDADVTASGQPFLVLEYINGMPISEYCDHHQLSIDERLKLFQQVLDAVRYAHSHLVIHRDLKPSNILITSDGIAHLLDFGIAKLTKDGELKETVLTQINGRALTPDYASPEQIMGGTITTVSDVYSLGVLLYELLTGTRPYRLCRDTRNALEEAIVTADVVLPSRAEINEQCAECRNISLRQLQKALAGDLDTLILKALKRSPAERYASTDAFFDDVNRYIHQQPILAQPDSQWYRAKKFIARNQLVVVSFAAIMIALIGGIGVALWQAHVARQERDRAVELAARGEAITEFMRLMVTETADTDAPVTMQTLLARAKEVAFKTFADNTEQQVAVLGMLGGYYLTLNKSELARDSFVKALELTTNNSDLALKAQLNCRAGRAYDQLGDVNTATKYIQTGTSISHGHPEVEALCLQERARLLYEKGDYRGALNIQEMARNKLRDAGSNPVVLAELLSDSADAELELGEIAKADRLYANAIEQLKNMGRGEQSLAMQIYNNWSGVESYSGNPRGALEYLDKARAIAIKRGIGADEGVGASANRGAQLFKLARYEESLSEYQKGINSAEKNHNASDIAATKQGMARTLIMLGRTPEAERLLKEAESLISKYLPNDGAATDNATLLRGLLALKQKRCGDAVNYLSRNIDTFIAHSENNGALVYNLVLRGEAHRCENNLMAASADAIRAYELARSLQRDMAFSKSSGEAALLLAKISHAQNKNDDAHKWADIAFQQLQGSVGAQHPSTVEAKHLLAQAVATNN